MLHILVGCQVSGGHALDCTISPNGITRHACRTSMWLDIDLDSARFGRRTSPLRARDALRRPGRLVVHRPAGPRHRHVDRASAASGSSVRTRAPSTPSSPSARSPPAAGSAATSTRSRRRSTSWPASCLIDIDGHVHRLLPGDYALMPVGTGTRWQRRRRAGPLVLGQHADAARSGRGAARHVLRATARSTSPPWRRRAARPPFGDPVAPLRRPLRRHAAAGRGAPRQRSGPWSRARRHGHGDPRLQRDLGEDARRPVVRRRPADDVHGRLRARRRGPGPRPPVRGGLLLPRRRDRGRARRRAATRSARATSCSPASARPMASSTPAAAGSAGSRPRHRSHPRATRIAGSTPGSGSRSTDMTAATAASSSSAGRRASARRSPATTPGTGRETVITGRDAAQAASRRRRDRRHGARASASTSPSPRRSATPSPRSARCATSRSWRSSATTTRSATSTSTGRSVLVTLKLVGYAEVVHALLDRLRPTARSSCSAARPRTGRIPARRRSRPSTAGSPGWRARSPGSWRRSGSTSCTRGSSATARTGTASRPRSSRVTCRRPYQAAGDDGRHRRRDAVPAREPVGRRDRPRGRQRLVDVLSMVS